MHLRAVCSEAGGPDHLSIASSLACLLGPPERRDLQVGLREPSEGKKGTVAAVPVMTGTEERGGKFRGHKRGQSLFP